jgi:hypothetical protein
MIKYYIALAVVAGSAVAYGVASDSDVAANAAITEVHSGNSGAVDTEKFTEEISRDRVYRAPSHTPNHSGPTATGGAGGGVIPTIILPNNVCVINTDISPDRTIEEHIIACIRAQRIRQSLTQ